MRQFLFQRIKIINYFPFVSIAKYYKGWEHVPLRHMIWSYLSSSGHKCKTCEAEAGKGSEAAVRYEHNEAASLMQTEAEARLYSGVNWKPVTGSAPMASLR